MRQSRLFLTIIAAVALGGCAVEPPPAPAGGKISASIIYIDSDTSDRQLDTDVSIAPTGTTPSSDGLNLTAPGGVNITAGDLAVEAGGLSVTGDLTVFKTADEERFVLIKNASAGSSASVALVMSTSLFGSGVRVMELRGNGYASGANDLRINIPESNQVVFYSTSGTEALAWVDDTDGFVAPTVTAEDQVIIEGLGSTSAPAIHFTEGTLPADTGFRIEAPDGNLVYRVNSDDVFTANSGGTFEIAEKLLVLNGNSTYFEENGIQADLSGYNTGLHFIPASERWQMDYYLRAPALATPPDSANLTADDQSIAVAGEGYVLIDSDDATASNRTFAIGVGAEAGQRIILQFAPSAGGACELRDDTSITGGAIRLTADWTPANYGTLSLVFDGTDWIETGRTAP